MLTDWISALNGEAVRARSFVQLRSLGLGHHKFAGLPDYVTAPALNHHYISVTLGEPVEVEGILSSGRLAARVGKGQVIIMAAGQANTWRWNQPTEEVHLFLDPRVVDRIADEAGGRKPELLNRFAVDDESISQIVRMMAEELDHPGPASNLMLETGAEFLAHHLLRNYCSSAVETRRRDRLTRAQLRAIEDHVDQNLGDDISLADMAALARLSPFHFARAFKETTGRSPHVWLTGKRMEKARELIETSALSILEVAIAVGYESQSHFGQVFRKWAGISPAELRRLSRS
jgi:AraC family transcriptional regulator